MFNLENEFKKFYYNEVVLPKSETNKLKEKKKLNIERLKAGLDEYNEENNTKYKVVQTVEQGSVAMTTIVQNEKDDYDIDVAIIFNDYNINGIGPNAIHNIIINALKRKCTNMKKDPYSKTNCVRIEYADNYHIDFAIYRRIKQNDDTFKYEHAGSEWRERDPYAINSWFKEELRTHGENLRQAIRLTKMFCKSRELWSMPGGLIQTVLCDESVQIYDRMDEMFYYTICKVRDRLKYNKEVFNPTDTSLSLLLVEKDKIKINNLYSRLNTYIEKLKVLFEDDCTLKKAKDACYDFFNNSYWQISDDSQNKTRLLSEGSSANQVFDYDDTEEYISNIFPSIYGRYHLELECRLTDKNKKMPDRLLSNILLKNEKIEIGYILDFYIKNTNVPRPYTVYWKVKNNGKEAIKNNCIRGQIFKGAQDNQEHHIDSSSFEGNHYVECYIVKNGLCVAKESIEVPIKVKG